MIVPVGDRILVRQEKVELSKNGLVVSQESEDGLKKPRGEVVSGGIYVENGDSFTFEVRVGDTVIFNEFAGERVRETDTSEELILLRPSEILAKIC